MRNITLLLMALLLTVCCGRSGSDRVAEIMDEQQNANISKYRVYFFTNDYKQFRKQIQ